MARTIHPTAVVDPAAVIGDGVTIGPYCCVGPDVTLKDGVHLRSHVVVDGWTELGERARVFPFAVVGSPPQDLKYKGERSRLVIGADTTIREHVTINPGTEGGGGLTSIGERCLIMVAAHVAHDCRIGNSVILVNNCTLAGHVTIGDFAILGGLSAVHQFVRIGEHAFVGGMAGVERDVIPFGMVLSDRAHLAGLNLVGLKRRGFGRDEIATLRTAFKDLFEGPGEWQSRIERVEAAYGQTDAVRQIIDFIRADSDRQFLQPRRAGAAD